MHALPYRLDPHARELFAQALEHPEHERAAFLVRECGPNEALLRRLIELLRSHAKAEDLLDEAPTVGEQSGDRIGHYKLLQRIGEGGFGTVWMAEQEEPVRRKVALKVLKPGLDTNQVIGRFEAERQALALMDHPNIAKVFDGGATDHGRPFFVMELVKGVPITKYCDAAQLSPNERAELFVLVCQAVQHAHQKGVIHRDLKPSNILVTMHDGKPVPKVIDFGIAKATAGELTTRTVFTEFRQMLGTPEYMAPEQAELSGLDVDTRADVYSLGVLLYELLTGIRPFALATLLHAGYAEMVRTIREVDPPKPSTRVSTLGEELLEVAKHRKMHPRHLSALMRGDLDWIVMKALEKERNRRYETATALAEDVGRHLRHEPVLAGPPSQLYRLRKYVRRHRVGVTAGAAILLSLVAGGAAAGWGYVAARENAVEALAAGAQARQQATEAERARAEEQRQREAAQRSERKAERVVQLVMDMLGSSSPHEPKGKDYTVRQLLDDFAEDLGTKLTDEPEVVATLRVVIASSYLGLGLPARAEPHLALAGSHWGQVSEPESMNAALCLMLRARWLHDLGRYRDAAQDLERARARVARLEGARSPTLAAMSAQQAELYEHLGEMKKAEMVAREGLDVLRGLPPGNDASLVDGIAGLARILRKQGRLAEAEQLGQEALTRTRAALGDDHRSVASFKDQLADTLTEQGRLIEAETLRNEALALLRSIVGDEHPQIARLQAGLAGTLGARGQFAEAVALERQVLAMRRRLHGDDHLMVTTSMANLAAHLAATGGLAEAEALQRQVLAVEGHTLGEDHPETLTSRSNLAVILGKGPRLAEAEALHRDVLEKTLAGPGADQPAVVVRLANLANILLRSGKLTEAEAFGRRALDQALRILGPSHPHVAVIEMCLGVTLTRLRRFADAATFHRQALELRQRLYAEDHPEIATSMQCLADTLAARGEAAEAESVARQALAMRQRIFGGSHLEVAKSLGKLAELLETQGRLAEAEPLFRELIEQRRSLAGEDRTALRNDLHRLGVNLSKQGKYAESVPLLREAVDLSATFPTDPDPGIANTLANLAHGLKQLGRIPEAETSYVQALEVFRKHEASLTMVQTWHMAFALLSYGTLLDQQGRRAEAESHVRRSVDLERKLLTDDPANRDTGARLTTALEWLTRILRDEGKLAEAEPFAREALALKTQQSGERSVEVATLQLGLARILLLQDRPVDAEALARASLSIRAEKLAGQWRYFSSQAFLARALALQGRRVEAEPLLVEACTRMQPSGPEKNVRQAIEWLIELYEADGRGELAAPWRARLQALR